MRRVCWLHTRAARRSAVAGGKGASLASLCARGYPVPEAFVVTARGFREFAAAAGIDLGRPPATEHDRSETRRRILSTEFPLPLAAAIRSAASRLGGPLAVRSSLAEEDAADRSYAGQLESVLGVSGAEDCLGAVRRVYASLFAASLAAYASKQARPASTPRLAVVVQRMLDPLAAGVAFSLNPVTREPNVVVEAAPGIASAILHGSEAPGRFEVGDGVVLNAERRGVTPSRLSEATLIDLAALVRRLARQADRDLDVEWAWDGEVIWLLQSRPITAVGGHVYSRRLVGDMAPGLIRPLVWSTHYRSMNRRVFGRLFTELLGATGLDFATLTRRFHSRMYADVTAFGELLECAGLPRNFFEAMTRQERSARRPRMSRRLLAVMPRAVRFLWRHGRPAPAIERFLEHRERETQPLRASDWRDADVATLLTAADRLLTLHGDSQWHTFLAAMSMSVRNRMLQRLLSRRAPEIRASDLTRGVSRLKGLEPNAELRRLASEASWAGAVSIPLLASGDDGRIRSALGATEAGQHLCSEVAAFLLRFGYLAADGTDFSQPRWAEQPGLVWQALARHLEVTSRGATPDASIVQAERSALSAEVRARLSPPLRPWFDVLVRSTSRYMALRERASAAMSDDAFQARRLFLAVGSLLASRGALPDRDAVFLLYYDELKALADGRLPGVSDLVACRRAELGADAGVDPVESFRGDYPTLAPPSLDRHEVLRGIPGSAGLVRGYARVVLDPASAPAGLSRSDVLVVPFTDIGWSPLLAVVGGVVADCGGQLSHTAIIAREYGIPTVVSVSQATRRIRDGQALTVDGTRGLIYLTHL